MVRSSAERDNERGEDEGRHDEDLAQAEPELGFAEAVDMKDLETSA